MIAPNRINPRPAIVKGAVLAYDLAAAWIAFFAAVHIRRYLSPGMEPSDGVALISATVFTLVCAFVFPTQRLHLGVWRFTALNDLIRIVNAITIANLTFLLAMFLFNRLAGVPRLSLLIEAGILLTLLVGARLTRQSMAFGEWRSVMRLEDRSKPAAILAGRQSVMDAYLRDLSRRALSPPFRVRGLVDVEDEERGRSIRGAPLLGGPREVERALISLTSNGQTPQLIIVDPEIDRARLSRLVRAASEAKAALVRAHAVQGGPAGIELTHVDAADLLSRPPHALEVTRPRNLVSGRRVLVTGAGGTIGSELVRQIAAFDPAHLTLLDASEHALYQIDLEHRERHADQPRSSVLADVRDEARMARIMARERPDVVFHAAALKHVPLMESNPSQAALTNIGGTMITARAARDAGVGVFVLISSDKAVYPSSVMGATKRAAELFVQALDATPGHMRAVSVRFGNVLGSNGSVLPLFERQIRAGGPITITHPDATRYFMTTDEAVSLVLQSAALGPETAPGGGIFVLDMGDAMRIEELARTLCRLRGFVPDRDIAIERIGLRPGEKMHETLFYDVEAKGDTAVPGVLFAAAPVMPNVALAPKLDAILQAARADDADLLRQALSELVAYAPPDTRRERN